MIDNDLRKMSREDLINEVMMLRQGIRIDRNTSGHDLCHYRPELWNLLPEKDVCSKPKVPSFWEFMWRCFQYRLSLCKKGGCCG